MNKVKYPRTYHLPYSPTMTPDDKRLESDSHFKEMESVVVTIKMDGENCTVYNDGTIHARSLDGYGHPWQEKVMSLIQNWCYTIPENYRVCGENLQAEHSIKYILNSFNEDFQCFGIYNNDLCLSWEDTCKFCSDNKIAMVPTLYIGKYDKDLILKLFNEYCASVDQEVEGFVVRNANSFNYNDFKGNVGKYVRENHVQTDEHWTKHWKNNIIVKKC